MEKRLVFFDMDGTLVVPCFDTGEKKVLGFTIEEWLLFCRTKGEDAYKDCRPVGPVVRYAKEKKSEGAELFVLSTVLSGAEIKAKRKMTEEKFPGLFSDVLTVKEDAKKIEVIRKMAKEKGIPLKDCELVEDSFKTLLLALEAGIEPTHIAAIVEKL